MDSFEIINVPLTGHTLQKLCGTNLRSLSVTQDYHKDFSRILVSTTPLTRIFLNSKRLQYSLQSLTLDLHSFKGDKNLRIE